MNSYLSFPSAASMLHNYIIRRTHIKSVSIDVLRYYLQGNSHIITKYFLPTLSEQWEVPSVPASSNRNWYTNQAAALRTDKNVHCLARKVGWSAI